MVIPGTQALLGFQFIAVFNPSFINLPFPVQIVHYIAMVFTIIALTLLLSPAAFHRLVDARKMWDDLLHVTSFFITVGMVPIAFAVAADVFVIAMAIFRDFTFSLVSSLLQFAFMMFAWFVLPELYKLSGRSQV